MSETTVESYVAGAWRAGDGEGRPLYDATTEEQIGTCGTKGVDFQAVLAHARERGGPALRAMTFAERGAMLQALSKAIHAQRDALLDVSARNAGTTRSDGKFDVDGATGTLMWYGKLGESLGDRRTLTDGEGVQLGRTARFWGRHVLLPLHGAAIHINAFNFPAWNMMEKAACALLAGVPVVEKPGTPTAMVAWATAKAALESGALPEGAFQFLAGGAGDLLDRLGPQDAIAFTGSAETANTLRVRDNLIRHSVRFNVEADSLNAAVLGPDAEPDSETFRLFVKNVVLDMRQKTGQKCTAVRRVLAPKGRLDAVRDALVAAIDEIVVGDPSERETTMGPVVSREQLDDVREGIERFAASGRVVTGGTDAVGERGWFVAPTLLETDDAGADIYHEREVFGPVATLMAYDGSAEAAATIVNRGSGSLVGSVYSNEDEWTRRAVLAMGPWHGRLWLGSDRMAEQSVPPGTVLPMMTHGGPGRAGGGEELGGLRGLSLYLQRTALQGFKGRIESAFGDA